MMTQWISGQVVKTTAEQGLKDPDINKFGEYWARTYDAGRLIAIGGGDGGGEMWYTAYVGPMPNPYSPLPVPEEQP